MTLAVKRKQEVSRRPVHQQNHKAGPLFCSHLGFQRLYKLYERARSLRTQGDERGREDLIGGRTWELICATNDPAAFPSPRKIPRPSQPHRGQKLFHRVVHVHPNGLDGHLLASVLTIAQQKDEKPRINLSIKTDVKYESHAIELWHRFGDEDYWMILPPAIRHQAVAAEDGEH